MSFSSGKMTDFSMLKRLKLVGPRSVSSRNWGTERVEHLGGGYRDIGGSEGAVEGDGMDERLENIDSAERPCVSHLHSRRRMHTAENIIAKMISQSSSSSAENPLSSVLSSYYVNTLLKTADKLKNKDDRNHILFRESEDQCSL